jgi:hypothetical protein
MARTHPLSPRHPEENLAKAHLDPAAVTALTIKSLRSISITRSIKSIRSTKKRRNTRSITQEARTGRKEAGIARETVSTAERGTTGTEEEAMKTEVVLTGIINHCLAQTLRTLRVSQTHFRLPIINMDRNHLHDMRRPSEVTIKAQVTDMVICSSQLLPQNLRKDTVDSQIYVRSFQINNM